ncbi:hypothetical protein ONE63_007076 [Megalurothrips usitatus]|uniref:HORMA domain-containing protein n=1 Tax=Megalurothrips usitatus TaxID=439358 RepID=A0AAV7XYE5_9NEOP|nr:hypothetical protein ONE63_007076 [Megalurothrips usitatus]
MSTPPLEIDVVDILIEFLEVSIHHLLFLRNLYPSSIFVLRKMYNVPVHVSKHPGVNQYITEVLQSARVLLRLKGLKSLTLCFYNDTNMPIERFVFDLLNINENFRVNQNSSDSYLLDLRNGFRAFSLKIAAFEMKPLSDKCSFQIHLLTTEQGSQALANDPMFEDFPWIELEDEKKVLQSPSIAPIRTIETDYIKLQMYHEMSSR